MVKARLYRFACCSAAETSQVLALRFDDGNRRQPHEQDVVGRPAHGGPFSNRQVLALLGASTLRLGERGGISLPPRLSKLLVDELAGFSFIKLHHACGRIRCRNNLRPNTRWPCRGCHLLHGQAVLQCGLRLIRIDRHLLPERLLGLCCAKLLLHHFEPLRRGLVDSLVFLRPPESGGRAPLGVQRSRPAGHAEE